jgi:glycosyltransferase involved in cell wall biosynthesis
VLSRPHLSVVVPAYNEQDRLPPSLERIDAYLRTHKIEAEIVVVDDGSNDRTAELAEDFLKERNGRVISLAENLGKGAAVRRGVLEARGRWVLMTDADLSAPIEQHLKLASTARDNDVDIVIGSRGLRDSQIEVHQAWPRQTMGKTFNVLMRAMTGLPFRDTQCGFKLMDRDRVLPLFEKMAVDRFAFDIELLFLAVRYGLSVREVPVVWRNVLESRVNMILDPINMLLDVARIRWRFRRGAYNPDTP